MDGTAIKGDERYSALVLAARLKQKIPLTILSIDDDRGDPHLIWRALESTGLIDLSFFFCRVS